MAYRLTPLQVGPAAERPVRWAARARSFVMRISIEPGFELRLLQLENAAGLESLREGYTAYRGEWLYRGTASEFIQACLQSYRNSSRFCLGVFLQTALAGVVITSIEPSSGSAQIDYMLGDAYRGRGLATKAVQAIVSYLFRDLNVERVKITPDAKNSKSCAVAERLGFTIESRIPDAIDYGDAKGEMLVYEARRSTWRAA